MDLINTKLVKIDPNNIDYDILNEAAGIIENGGTVIFPTETVYGLGADAMNEAACMKIFEAKCRPADNPLIVHISKMEELNTLVLSIPQTAKVLADKYWPGPLTMIFDRNESISNIVTAGLNTVAIRYPNNKIAIELIRLCKTPIAAPSANTSGKPSPTSVEHVIEDMMGRVDMIIDGGSCDIGLESSVVDVTAETPMILRPGKITAEDIEELFGKCDYDQALINSDDKIIPKSPGQKYRHYSPKAEVILYDGNLYKVQSALNKAAGRYIGEGKTVGIMATEQTKHQYSVGKVISVGDRNNPSTIAHNLFNTLRDFDKLGVDIILAETFDDTGMGKAIMNRLSKAASKKIDLGELKLLFVCTGNTCRSSMAKGIMEHIALTKKQSISVDSAGISANYGDSASINAITALKLLGIDISDHMAKPVDIKLLNESDLILTMTCQHKQILLSQFKGLNGKVYTLKEFGENDLLSDISDPYGGNLEVYKHCCFEIKQCLDNASNKIFINLERN